MIDYNEPCNPVDIQNNKVIAILAYLHIAILIPLFFARKSRFARFHTNQGLVIFFTNVIVSAIAVIGNLLVGVSPLASLIVVVISNLCNTGLFILSIVGIAHVLREETVPLPILGKIRILRGTHS